MNHFKISVVKSILRILSCVTAIILALFNLPIPALCMVGGILTIILLEYIPFFLQLGPGADLLFSSTFGGPFMSLLIVFAPQVIVFSFICTYCYRKTGNVFVGALIVAIMACWIVTGGSAILYTF